MKNFYAYYSEKLFFTNKKKFKYNFKQFKLL